MKKNFVKVTLFSLLAFGATVSFVSCKDYDDDITNIGQVNDDQGKQIAALEEALNAAKAAADAAAQKAEIAQKAATDAATKGDNALAAAQAAQAAAAQAEAAAAKAKQEAIEAAIQAVKDAFKGMPTADDLKNLSSRIEGIEGNLSTLSSSVNGIDERVKAIEQLNIQLKALLNYKDAIEKLPQALQTLAGLQHTVSDIDAAVKNIEKTQGELTNDVKEINGKLDAISDEVSKIQPAILTIMTGRLTSVTLVPDLYVDGIETIEFVSLEYVPMNPSTLSRSGSPVIVSTEFNPASYRLNPTSTALKDVVADDIEFVALQANSRGVVASPIAYVAGSAEISNTGLSKGVLTVNAKKVITGSLNDPMKNGNSIYAVALKVPIAASHLQNPQVPEYVYSEYSRLQESTFTPRIAALPWSNHSNESKHYSDSTAIWQANIANDELVSIQCLYNQTVDLEKYVTGCLIDDNHSQITKAELKKYGMTFRFGLPTKAYTTGDPNSTDQQKFIRFDNQAKTIVRSQTPAGLTNNRAAVDKQPIVRVCLVDTVNNKLVDQRYLKVEWTAEVVPPVTIETQKYTSALSCNDQIQMMNWEKFVNLVYARIEGEKPDMSFEQFRQVYLNNMPTWEVKRLSNGQTIGSSSVAATAGMITLFDNNNDGDANALKWTLTPADIDNIVSLSGHNTPSLKGNVFAATITFKPVVDSYPVIVLPLEWTITLPATLPAIAGYNNVYWVNQYTNYAVYPVQYKTPGAQATCIYHNNLMNGFSFYNYGANRGRFIVKNLSECATWDLQFCYKNHQPTGYSNGCNSEPDVTVGPDIAAYTLKNGSLTAATLEWSDGHTSWCGNGAHNEVYVNLEKNSAGIGLLNGYVANANTPTLAAPIVNTSVGIWATLNPFNYWPVTFYNLNFVKPLSLDDVKVTDHFIDGVVSGSIINMSKAFKMTDCFGYAVAETTTGSTEKERYAADLYKYYEVQQPVYDLDNIKFGMKVQGGSVVVDPSATLATAMTKAQLLQYTNGSVIPSITFDSSRNQLVYKSNQGSMVTEAYSIWVPVSVTYGWGVEKDYVEIKVDPMKN